MKLMEGECIYTPARSSGQLPIPDRRPLHSVMSSNSGTRLAAQLLNPLSVSKVRRRLFADDFEPSTESNKSLEKNTTTVAAAASAGNSEICQRLLEECQIKWNFDLINCKPLEGRYEWEKMKPEEVPSFYSKPYTNVKRRSINRECFSPNMVANGNYNKRRRCREDGLSNGGNTTSSHLDTDVMTPLKLNSNNNNNNNNSKNNKNVIFTTTTTTTTTNNNNSNDNNNKYNGCDPNNVYDDENKVIAIATNSSITTTTTGGLENTNNKQQDITDTCNDSRIHNGSSNSECSSLRGGKSPLMCFTIPVKNVNSSNQLCRDGNVECNPLLGSYEHNCNNNNNNNDVFSEKNSDSCDTLNNSLLREQLDKKHYLNSTAIKNNTTISLSSSSLSQSSPSLSSLSPYSSTTSSTTSTTSATTTTMYPIGTHTETAKQTKIVDYMCHKKRTQSRCHTGNKDKKLRKE